MLTKEKSCLGYFLEDFEIKQEWLAKKTKLSQPLISQLVCDPSRIPRITTAKRIVKALKNYDPSLKIEHFWEYDN